MSDLLYGKSTVVTGAASGIGAATTRLLMTEGANVLATDIDDEKGETLVRELREQFPDKVQFLQHDVTDEQAWIKTLGEAESAFGQLDILVNNAGVLPAIVGLADTPLEDWRHVMSVNLDGAFLGVKHALRTMKDRGGAIVNVSSVAGFVGMPLTGAYSPSKGGVLMLTKAAALEGAGFNRPVRVNAVHPGYIQTDMTENIANVLSKERFDRHVEKVVPLKVMGSPEQIAEAIVFLASDKSQFTTGSSLVVDGGWTAQ
jgi:NAD(P)-dependent dehydrogenase (short-subunit alcohol dehydrogenase family)